MTFIATQSALSGLKAAQRALDTISTNIANASTEGYTRKILPQETLVVTGTGAGVKTNALVRNVDKALLRDLFKQYSTSSSSTVQEEFLSRIQSFHGASEAERSLSAQINGLSSAFADLSASPDNDLLLNKVLNNAHNVARGFNDFSKLLNDMRNEADERIATAVGEVNQALKRIADLNVRIANLESGQQSNADLKDQRDLEIRRISQYMQISTFTADYDQIVVMTKQGQALADDTARELVFTRNAALPSSYYPGGGLSGIHIDSASGIEIDADHIGGEIGGLMTMRDDTLPTYRAQLDELAQKLAERMDQQGLRLFTNSTGSVPASIDPPAAVSYVGFSGNIQVNADIVDDATLLRSGTYGATVLPGSNEVISRVIEYAFGAYRSQEATGTVDISAGTIFAASGMTQHNEIFGNMDITDYAPDLDAAPNIAAPAQFTLTIAGSPYNITINPGDTATDLVNNINTAVGSNVAALNGIGQLRLSGGGDITFTDISLGAAGIADLGFAFTTYTATDPSFTVQVGTQSPVSITIGAGDTQATLLAALNAVPGLTATLGTGGELILTPTYGGSITVRNTNGNPLDDLGMSVGNVAHTSFRSANMGPNADLSTGLLSNSTLADFSRSMISAQSEDHALMQDTAEKEAAYYDTLNKRNTDQTGVNIDEEVSALIRIQTAYSAAARMISAVERTFDDLLAAFTP